MICPKCKLDYADLENDETPVRVVIKVDDHFYKPYRRIARRCPHCGYVAEWIEKPTGNPYFKRPFNPVKTKNRRARRSQTG